MFTMTKNISTILVNQQRQRQRPGTWYCTSYMSQTHDQKHFMILEVIADWHELMIPQCTRRPSTAHISEQLNPQSAASRHTITPISHKTISYYSFPILLRVEG